MKSFYITKTNKKMMVKRHMIFWDYLAWFILLLITIWLILKVSGVIQTPSWLQYSPLFGVVYLAGWAMKKLDTAIDDIKDIKDDVKYIEKDINILRKKCPELNSKNKM